MKKVNRKETIIYIAILVFSVILYLFSGSSPIPIPSEGIRREAPGNADRNYLIDAHFGDSRIDSVEVEVAAREYSEEELDSLAENYKDRIVGKLFSESGSAGIVTGDLNFYESLNGLPFEFKWQPADRSLIDGDGRLRCETDFDTVIYLNLSYMSYSKDFSIPIHASPGMEAVDSIQKEKLTSLIQTHLNNAMKKTDYVSMPDSVNGEKATFYFSGTGRDPIFLLLGAVTTVCLYIGFRKDRESEIKKRKQKIVRDLPGVLQKMTMYITSGMTFRNIWLFLCEKAQSEGRDKEPIYEEMKVSANELKSGISETMVYSGFGERTATPETVRFTALVSQNIITGSTDLSELLRMEAANALTERKQRAVKAGEEAGTKLLFPMMILLAVMLAIIMVPAFMNI